MGDGVRESGGLTPLPRESKAARRARAVAVDAALQAAYPHSTCALDHESPYQLLVATALSAQTTDVKVNEATAELFARFPTPEAMAEAPEGAIEACINGLGLWRNKARNVRAAARLLVEEFGGVVPRTVEELTRLPGVGRKTATAVLGTAFGLAAGVTVDTHMLRINRLLKLSTHADAQKMAHDMEALLPREVWSGYTHRVIDHGRLVCVARRPRCGVCVLQENGLCPSAFSEDAGYKQANDAREPASAKGLSWLSRRSP